MPQLNLKKSTKIYNSKHTTNKREQASLFHAPVATPCARGRRNRFAKRLYAPGRSRVSSSGSPACHASFFVARDQDQDTHEPYPSGLPFLVSSSFCILPAQLLPSCRLDPGGEFAPTSHHAPRPPPSHTSLAQTPLPQHLLSPISAPMSSSSSSSPTVTRATPTSTGERG
jgi:hypothetical protein